MYNAVFPSSSFNEAILSNKYVLVDFWATWCGPCMMIAPVIEKIARENDDIVVGKVNVDEEMSLAMAFKIESIPTLVVVKDGQVVNQMIGLRQKEDILNLINL